MKQFRIATGAAAAALALTGAAHAQQAMQNEPTPETAAPFRMAGAIINVEDLDGMRDWYVAAFGMNVVRVLERGGTPFEYILSTDEERGTNAIVGLMRAERQDGSTTYGRLLLHGADNPAVAEHLQAQGVPVRRVGEGIYYVTDPEGNTIELYPMER
jgi:catechol 2,3-dioxygenase-like lactoylglutathione lyase family enzyme